MSPRSRAAFALAFAVLGVPGIALGQSGARQSASLEFDEQHPGETSGTRLAVDYVNSEDAAAKPRAVQRVQLRLAPGTTFDTSVPPRCEASDQQLMASGPSACPAASRVGGGELDLDTGVPGPGRILQYNVTFLSNTRQLIFVLESKSNSSQRIIARAVIDGASITTDVTGVPGGPPDGYVAIKRVRLKLEPRATGQGANRRSYIATPATCPRERRWTNTAIFTYRDGVTQTLTSTSPCVGSSRDSARRLDNKAPRIRVAGIPRRRCAGRDFRARVRIGERWSGLRRAELWLDGRRRVVTRSRRFSRRIRAARLRGSRHRVVVVALDRAGNRSVRRVRFRKCS